MPRGVDGIPGELLEYSVDAITEELMQILSEALTSGCDIALGRGLLIPLPKPGKPPGPLAHLRPVVLLNASRQWLSLVTLARIAPQVDRYLPLPKPDDSGKAGAPQMYCGARNGWQPKPNDPIGKATSWG